MPPSQRGKYLSPAHLPPRAHPLIMSWDPQVYDGRDIGRYINHGGLRERIRALVASCNREDGCDMYQPHVAEKLFDDHSNVVYARVGRDMVVTAKDAITTSPNNATELLANYGLPYWLAFAVRNHVHLGHDCELVKGVFWLLLSRLSTMPPSERGKYITPDSHIPENIRQMYFNLRCPFPKERRSRVR